MAKFLITSALPYINGVKHIGNLVNRCLRFLASRYGGVVPEGGVQDALEAQFHADLTAWVAALHEQHEALNFRKAVGEVRAIWSLANGYLAAASP